MVAKDIAIQCLQCIQHWTTKIGYQPNSWTSVFYLYFMSLRYRTFCTLNRKWKNFTSPASLFSRSSVHNKLKDHRHTCNLNRIKLIFSFFPAFLVCGMPFLLSTSTFQLPPLELIYACRIILYHFDDDNTSITFVHAGEPSTIKLSFTVNTTC